MPRYGIKHDTIDEGATWVGAMTPADTLFWLTLPVFVVDMILNLFTTGLCAHNQKIGDPQDWWDNMKMYLIGWFWIDIVALIPWSEIFKDGNNNSRSRGTCPVRG